MSIFDESAFDAWATQTAREIIKGWSGCTWPQIESKIKAALAEAHDRGYQHGKQKHEAPLYSGTSEDVIVAASDNAFINCQYFHFDCERAQFVRKAGSP